LFNHPDDTGEEETAPLATTSESVSYGGVKEPAQYRLKAFISHKGPSVHSGHYVAHIRTAAGWTLFNDEKVVKADDESVADLKKLAYLYFFEKAT
jgi:ubiquitin carboxyl-terminal hydrolase 5/13